MPIGTSDPSQPYFEDEYAHAVAQHTNKEAAIGIHPVEGTPDAPPTTSRMPSGGPGEPTGAFNSVDLGRAPFGVASTNEIPEGSDVGKAGINFIKDTYQRLKDFSKTTERPVDDSAVRFKTASPLVNITDKDIDTATDVAMSFGTGTMAGVKSKLVDKAALGEAQVMEANGVHSDVIRYRTGFEKGAEGRWKYEIDDSKSSFDRKWAEQPVAGGKIPKNSDKVTNTLPNILDHPELYKAYPHLKDVRVTYDPTYPVGGAEWQGGLEQRITMGPQAHNNQGILMHEVQHAIQDHEGFAKGGSPGEVGKDFELKYTKAVNDLTPEANKILEKVQAGKPLTLVEEDKADYFTQVFKKYLEYKEAGVERALENYKKLAGETEARNTDTRLLMTAEERRHISPESTEDVLREHQFVVDRPAFTSAYGVIDPKTGLTIKPKSEPTTFRRAANENKRGSMDSFVDETGQIRGHIVDEAMDNVDKSWKQMAENSRKAQALFEERIALLNKTRGGMSDHELARYNKLGKQQADIEGTTWEPFTEKMSPESIQYQLKKERIAQMEDKLDQAGELMRKKDFNSADRELVKKLLKEHEDLDKLNKKP